MERPPPGDAPVFVLALRRRRQVSRRHGRVASRRPGSVTSLASSPGRMSRFRKLRSHDGDALEGNTACNSTQRASSSEPL